MEAPRKHEMGRRHHQQGTAHSARQPGRAQGEGQLEGQVEGGREPGQRRPHVHEAEDAARGQGRHRHQGQPGAQAAVERGGGDEGQHRGHEDAGADPGPHHLARRVGHS